MQYLENFISKRTPQDFISRFCGHVGGLGLAIESEKWKKIGFEYDRG